jgi:small subunit ribosomal protein S6
MPSYETLCIFHPELPETRVKELAAWMQKLVENGQGNVLKVEEWGMRDLTYRIKKQRRGYYVRLEYDSAPAALKELERNLRLNENVLRFLSVVRGVPAPVAQPQAAQPVTAAAPASVEASEAEQ